MNEELTQKVFIWILRIISLSMLLAMILVTKSCVDGVHVHDYSGWIHECEIAGGVAHDGVCYDPSALIDMSDRNE